MSLCATAKVYYLTDSCKLHMCTNPLSLMRSLCPTMSKENFVEKAEKYRK